MNLFTAEQLRDAFLSGVVTGRLDKSNLKPIQENDIEAERQKVEEEYGPYWPGELLMAGYFDDDGKVGLLEHAGWLRKQKVAA